MKTKEVISVVRVIVLTLIIVGLGSVAFGQSSSTRAAATVQTSSSEAQAQKLVYNFVVATLTADAELYKSILAKRAIKLYEVVFLELCRDVRMKDAFRQIGITNGEEFFYRSAKETMREMPAVTQQQIERRAAQVAKETRVEKVDAHRLAIGKPQDKVFAVFEDGEWKFDNTAMMKNLFLSRFSFSQESRLTIENF